MKKISYKKIILFIFIIIFSAIFIFSIIKIINYLIDNQENQVIKDQIKEYITISKDINELEEKYEIDFDSLKKQNQDTIGYLKVNGTNIDYVVVKSKDNDYYLSHNFNKNWNISGWVFLDYRNKLNDTDKNIIIYGHNTQDGSMFGTLKNVLNSKWQEDEDNLKIKLITEKDEYTYQVFSTYIIKAESYYINTNFKSDVEYLNFLQSIAKRSNYNYNIDLNKDDQILTLSSCTQDGSKRVVLHAKLIKNV